ncbi:unnamed protein product [Nippostrongylus brasiliensis]|uniref:DUF4150 domain-containing protein n=1 Tax=Nippostrongylus brasiliensis TaxID=27835 RepID=A0A0N4Y5W7_NIPBR|nr:unnamed protein product [Nippostrongylus brasiliensis]
MPSNFKGSRSGVRFRVLSIIRGVTIAADRMMPLESNPVRREPNGGFGIPMGTVVFSTHPPQYRDESEMYHGSSTSSLPSSKQRVRFNPDGTPRGVLKNGHDNY